MDFLLYHPSTRPTGRALAASLGVRSGCLKASSLRRLARAGEVGTLIRWGSQKALPIPVSVEINPASALALASNKYRALVKLEEAGLPVPAFSTNAWQLEGAILGRSFKGYGGKDIVVYRTPKEANERLAKHDFYTQYVPNRREYRIHVVRGKVIRVQGKYLDFPDQWTNPQCKNHGQGFRFRQPDKRVNQDRLDTAVSAVFVLGLHFGAVDLLVGEDRETYVLEVNTAPGCSPLTLSKYAEALRDCLG